MYAMGWEGYHLHLFQKGKTIYTTEESDDDFWFNLDNTFIIKLVIVKFMILIEGSELIQQAH